RDQEEGILVSGTDGGGFLGVGAADDQADAGIAVLAHVVLAQLGQAVAHQVVDMAAVGQGLVLKILGAGIGSAAEYENALALLLAVRQIRADGVQTHVGSQRHDVCLKIAGKVRFGVHFSGFGNVTALDVRNNRQTGGPGHLQRFGVGAHTIHAQGLIVGDLHFVAAGHPLGGGDQGAVEIHHVLPCRLGRIGGGQVADLGIQADADRTVGGYALLQFIHVGHDDSPVLIFLNLKSNLATLDGRYDFAEQIGAVIGAVL